MPDSQENPISPAIAAATGPALRRIIKIGEVCRVTGKSRHTIWRGTRDGSFPAAIQLGPNSIGWYEDEIAQWLASRPRVKHALAQAAA